jgi:hypothetical protein
MQPPDDDGVIDLDSFAGPDAEPDPCLDVVVEHLPRPEGSLGVTGSLLQFLYWPTIREHLKITPKPKRQRARGRPKGSKKGTTSTQAEVDLWAEGLSDPAIFDRLKPSHVFDGGRARRAKIYTFSPEKQARIHAAHKAGKQALRQAALGKRLRRKESGSEFLS